MAVTARRTQRILDHGTTSGRGVLSRLSLCAIGHPDKTSKGGQEMTVCIAAICEEGTSAVLASDTMVTNRMIPIEFEHPSKKMTPLADNCLALTAGDALAHSELFAMVRSEVHRFKDPTVEHVVSVIKKCYQSVRQQEIRERLLLPRGIVDLARFYKIQRALLPEIAAGIQTQIDEYDYGLEIIVAGTTGKSAHVYSVTDPGTSQCYDAINFHAIGIGVRHALNALITRGCYAGTPLLDALMMVYEAKTMAENAPGVGSTTDITIMSQEGIIDLRRDDIQRMGAAYDKWVRHDPNWTQDLKLILTGKHDENTGSSPEAVPPGPAEVQEGTDRSSPEVSSES
ncbi:hypothetical protein LCGC14_2935110, partial [marine sediment metagenome]